VPDLNRQLPKRVRRELLGKEAFERSSNLELAEANLDRQLPATCETHEAFVSRLRYRGSDSLGKLRSIRHPPEESMGVEEEAH
jgi:hypothetical protein